MTSATHAERQASCLWADDKGYVLLWKSQFIPFPSLKKLLTHFSSSDSSRRANGNAFRSVMERHFNYLGSLNKIHMSYREMEGQRKVEESLCVHRSSF